MLNSSKKLPNPGPTAGRNCGLRSRGGNVLIIILVTICFILLPLLIVVSQLGFLQIDRDRTQSVVDAAGLIAANDLSRIILNDENFGYVSLSNYPPIGKGTLAADGEPLPVTGINTLIGTIRQNAIIARELGNETMEHLSETDRVNAKKTIKNLNAAIKEALSGERGKKFTDIHGQVVNPIVDAQEFLNANLPKNVHLVSLTLSSGWLESGGTTNVAIPQPERLSLLTTEQIRGEFYKPFVDVPVDGKAFTFAGLGAASTLVSAKEFRNADDKLINSIVKLECVISRDNTVDNGISSPLTPPEKLRCVACCQPYSAADVGPKGVMTLRFTGGPIPGMQSWSDFLKPEGFQDSKITTYDAVSGDYNLDREARMVPHYSEMRLGTAQQFAEHLYCWLRNGGMRPRIDSVLTMINDSFKSDPKQIYAYEFGKDGVVSRRILQKDPFPVGVTADEQFSSTVDTRIQNGVAPIIIFRNNVKRLGTAHGGKHAGQPLAGNPLNWCEIPEYGGDEHQALGLGKGRLGTGLSLLDPTGSIAPDLAINNPNYSLFSQLDGRSLSMQPRRSFYSGGLALDIEIGGTTPPDIRRDVVSMRKLKR